MSRASATRSRPDRRARDGVPLAQGGTRAQLGDGHLTRPHLGGIRGGAKPARQRLLPGASLSPAQALEQRAAPEDVEVERVGMRRIRELLPAPSAPGEAVVQARQAMLVVPNGALRPRMRASRPLVQQDERQKYAHGQQQPGAREAQLRQRPPGENDAGGQEQASVTDRARLRRPARGSSPSRLEPRGVFASGVFSGHRVHGVRG